MTLRCSLRFVLLLLGVGCAGLAGQSSPPAESRRAVEHLVCGFERPEDLAALPGGEALLVSEYAGSDGEGRGALSVMVLATEARQELFRGPGSVAAGPRWGDPGCPGPPGADFSPHGFDLAKRADGVMALAVVQHGGRESIELFELRGHATRWELAWRGCLVAPDFAWLNDVVWLPGSDGELLTTHMRPRPAEVSVPTPDEDSPKAPDSDAENDALGFVLHWAPGVGFREVPGTRGMVPNGIEVSEDGKEIFLNLSLDYAVQRIDRATGNPMGRAELGAVDNSTWAPDGKLLVASMQLGSPEGFASCLEHEGEACPLPFSIEALDPTTMRATTRYQSRGVPLGGGTVGLQLGNELFVGSFGGDCILRVDLEGLERPAP